MARSAELLALDAFSRAATRVPAYRTLLHEAGVRAEEIQSLQDFQRLPVLEKRSTFQRFGLEALCVDGELGRPGTLLTSSGHSGIFAFGVTDADALSGVTRWIDDSLDHLFAVRSRPTLLINCLPMGVKVPTAACTLAETSVRPDMAVALVKTFGKFFSQIVFLSDPAFFKHLLETGQRSGLDWPRHTIHAILGEEPLAENARRYFGEILGHDPRRPERGIVFSSMGVAELGLNLFFEVPPLAPLIALRRWLHQDERARESLLGAASLVPSLFTYDPRRIHVEFDATGRLIVTTLDPQARIPLIRYAPGDRGRVIRLAPGLRPAVEAQGIAWSVLNALPIVAIDGRGDAVMSGGTSIYPEAVKEGLYLDSAVARLTTANFRLASEPEMAVIRIQLSPGIAPDGTVIERFGAALSRYIAAPHRVVCERYENFGNGMALDYERKFPYLAR